MLEDNKRSRFAAFIDIVYIEWITTVAAFYFRLENTLALVEK